MPILTYHFLLRKCRPTPYITQPSFPTCTSDSVHILVSIHQSDLYSLHRAWLIEWQRMNELYWNLQAVPDQITCYL